MEQRYSLDSIRYRYLFPYTEDLRGFRGDSNWIIQFMFSCFFLLGRQDVSMVIVAELYEPSKHYDTNKRVFGKYNNGTRPRT